MEFSSTPSSPILGGSSAGHLGDDDSTQDPLGGLGQVFSNSDRAPLANANSLALAAVNLTVAAPPKRGRPVGAKNQPATAAKPKKSRCPSIPWCARQDKAVVVAFFETEDMLGGRRRKRVICFAFILFDVSQVVSSRRTFGRWSSQICETISQRTAVSGLSGPGRHCMTASRVSRKKRTKFQC